MELPLLEGIQKQAVLEIAVPALYGYFGNTGGKLSDTLVRGALIGAALKSTKSIGEILSGDTTSETFSRPLKGLLAGGGSAFVGRNIAPSIIEKLRQIEGKTWGKKIAKGYRGVMSKIDSLDPIRK